MVLKNADRQPDDHTITTGSELETPASNEPEAPANNLAGPESVTGPKPSGWQSLIHRLYWIGKSVTYQLYWTGKSLAYQLYRIGQSLTHRPYRIGRSQTHRPYRIGRHWSVPQVLGGVLIAAVCAAAVIWYVPRVVGTDREALTGEVTSSGVLALNFQNSGVISIIKVEPNETVHKGQVLAVEYAPTMGATIAADNAAITAVQAKVAELKSDETTYPLNAPQDQAEIAAENAQMATGQAQLDTDRAKLAETEIIAPSAGVVVAANGQADESVTSTGIRNYQSSAQETQNSDEPAFSLLPEGPQSSSRSSSSQSSLPVITLRVSSFWSVVAYVSESSVSGIKSGQRVTVSVPAAGIKDVPGHIQEVLPDPVESSSGLLYEAMVTISGSVPSPPLNDMAANIQLSG